MERMPVILERSLQVQSQPVLRIGFKLHLRQMLTVRRMTSFKGVILIWLFCFSLAASAQNKHFPTKLTHYQEDESSLKFADAWSAFHGRGKEIHH